jgi:broad specificity phosphatase PhoE
MSGCAIGLLRHGEPVGGPRYRGRTDDPLTLAGWLQLVAAIESAPVAWVRIISSPLLRCAAFAEVLASHLQLPLYLEPRLRELDFGAWEGRTSTELLQHERPALLRFWADPVRYPPPQGETLTQLQTRVLAAWRELRAGPQPVLIISHGGPMRIILGHLQGLPLQRLLALELPYGALRCLTHAELTASRPAAAKRRS